MSNPANPQFVSNGITYTFAGVFDANGNFAVGHAPAATAIISSNSAACSATVGQAEEIVPFLEGRTEVTVCNRSVGNETIDLGGSTVQPGNGIPVGPGGTWTFRGSGAAGPIYAASPVASTPVSWVDA